VLEFKRYHGRLLLRTPLETGPLDGVVLSFSGGVLSFFSELRSGIPGVGVPAGWFLFLGAFMSGIPGVGVPPGGTGDVEMPGGSGLELAFGAAGELGVLLF